MVDPLSYFSFQSVLHDQYTNGRGMCCPFLGMVHIKDPLLLIEKRSPSIGGSGFPISLCPLPHIQFYINLNNVLSTSLNKTFPSFLPEKDTSKCLSSFYSATGPVSMDSEASPLLGGM